jgi:predicted ATPase
MPISFIVLKDKENPAGKGRDLVQLSPGDWDDYSFKTSFNITFFDSHGRRFELGTTKIGFVGQLESWSLEKIPVKFSNLPPEWFSLGQDVEYYKAFKSLPTELGILILEALRDVVVDKNNFNRAEDEAVFSQSLMRGVSLSVINGQFTRVLAGKPVITDFSFQYLDPGDERNAAIELDFQVLASSKPPTNLHVLIGRNGVGKTTLLNNMVGAILKTSQAGVSRGYFLETHQWSSSVELPGDYFSSVVSVSFSAFDPFVPPLDQPDRTRGIAYFYVGMKNSRSDRVDGLALPPKTNVELANDFLASFKSCMNQPSKRDRWLSAIQQLESDENFADMSLGSLADMEGSRALKLAKSIVERMSSGHSIVLLTITKLVELVEEKTLVLMDEPESHLHPPLLSAFTRALANLLQDRNGVAIIATHSPVVVQEVPKSCVWKLFRLRTSGRSDRPERETFGENVGILTREIFGLEVVKSGFHAMLQLAVQDGGTFESISHAYNDQLGVEARSILSSLIAIRDLADQSKT